MARPPSETSQRLVSLSPGALNETGGAELGGMIGSGAANQQRPLFRLHVGSGERKMEALILVGAAGGGGGGGGKGERGGKWGRWGARGVAVAVNGGGGKRGAVRGCLEAMGGCGGGREGVLWGNGGSLKRGAENCM